MKTIIKYEMDKIIKNKSFIGGLIVSLFVLAGILFVGFYYSQINISGDTIGEVTEYYQQVVSEHSGELTDQRVNGIISDYMDRFQSNDGDDRPSDLFSWEIADTFFPEDEDIYTEMRDAMEYDEKVTIDEIEIKTVDEVGFTQFENPLKLGSYITWDDLFNVSNQLFILTIIITILICSLVFSNDTWRNTNQLLLSTKFGRNKLTISKIMAAISISSCAFLVIHVISLMAFYIYNSGFNGWDTSIQTNFSLEQFGFPVELNHLQVFLLMIALHFISMLAIVGITLFVSSVARTPFGALAISLGLLFLPKALTEIFKRGIIYKLLNLFPINNYDISNFLTLLSSKHDFLLDSFVKNIVLTMIFLLLAKMVLDCIIYLRMKKYQVT